ncbi:MAG: Smr/MutS family protein [Bacteroidia bacterium]|nr:Smr/MutS family protein [Bacteroidia bacterium]
MLYPHDFELKTGFDTIRNLLKNFCSSPMGEDMVNKIRISVNYNFINKSLEQTSEFKSILEDGYNLPEFKFYDISIQINKLQTEGIFLIESELSELKNTCDFVFLIKNFFKKKENKFPYLYEIYSQIEIFEDVIKVIENVIDTNGEMKPDSSPKYNSLLKEIKKTENDIHRKLLAVFNKAQNDGFASDTGITIRNGRPVIPIKSEHKKKISGIVHDESGSGTVLYIEPNIIVEENNKLKHLEIEKNREREQILKHTTLLLMPFRNDFEVYNKKVAITDFIRAKALLSVKLNLCKPKILIDNKNNSLILVDATHPVLYNNLSKIGKKPVSLNCTLNEKNRIMVISGPNAGGKSVALKTIAINQYMMQCGFLISASPDSVLPIFKQLMVDIGDNQSIDNNLSSYSAHLQAMNIFTKNAKNDTLFFIDELGSGTDPQFGGALGEAILKKLNDKKSFGVVTSHFSNIKNFAGQNDGFINASMLYDLDNYMPLYKLVIGKPGSSYAIELAKKTGIDAEIIKNAKIIAGTTHQRIDELLAEYEQLLQKTKEKLKSTEEKDATLTKLIADYNELKEKLKNQKSSIINQAKIQADEILSNSRKLIENTISEIKRNSAEKENTSNLRKKIAEARTELKIENDTDKTNIELLKKLKVGCEVKIKDYNIPGKILKINKENILVETGNIKTKISNNLIEAIVEPSKALTLYSLKGYDYRNTVQQFNPRLDVRGMLADDALNTAIDAVDKALMLSVDKIWILHGKGDGILRKVIRENLKKIKHVKNIESEHPDFGGDGVTIIDLY